MTTSEELVARFTDPIGFKKEFGFFGARRGKRAHQIFLDSPHKGVHRAYTLDRREFDGNSYFVKAISVFRDLDEATLAELSREAQLLSLGRLRYEGATAGTMPDAIGTSKGSTDIHSLSRIADGILVYPVAYLDSTKKDSSWAVWAIDGATAWVHPLDDKKA